MVPWVCSEDDVVAFLDPVDEIACMALKQVAGSS